MSPCLCGPRGWWSTGRRGNCSLITAQAGRDHSMWLNCQITAGERVAYCYALMKIFDSTVRLTIGLRRVKGQWLIAHDHCAEVAPPSQMDFRPRVLASDASWPWHVGQVPGACRWLSAASTADTRHSSTARPEWQSSSPRRPDRCYSFGETESASVDPNSTLEQIRFALAKEGKSPRFAEFLSKHPRDFVSHYLFEPVLHGGAEDVKDVARPHAKDGRPSPSKPPEEKQATSMGAFRHRDETFRTLASRRPSPPY
jgi:hypothetical protein